jgi:NAD(P)-dependent dehydrogenase (short-subunit alcohol dehydrogenase family)
MEQHSSKLSSNFIGKNVIITGSGTGIGQAIAKKYAENGANIIILGRRKEPLDNTTRILSDIYDMGGFSGRIRSFPGIDVSDENGINEMFEIVKKEFGRIDIVINNAGISGPVKTFTNASYNDFKECVAIHLTGTFWTSVQSLQAMEPGAEIITIGTFFTEENRYEQRPYRFRTPYTAAQGAKNRLAEALAWELVDKGIRSVATNPGPVHSDRIYKTVYPKAAAEFLRIGGYPGLSSVEIERAANKALSLLGEEDITIKNGIREIAKELANIRENVSTDEIEKLFITVSNMLAKIQEIAEKIQNNTSKMIVDGQFLRQEDVAQMVLTLSDKEISRLINGRIVPNDHIFYPVKPIIGTYFDTHVPEHIKRKVVVLTIASSAKKDLDRVEKLARILTSSGVEQIVILTDNQSNLLRFKDFHSHSIDLSSEEHVRGILKTIRTKFGDLDAVVHFTGDYDYNTSLSSLNRKQWNFLVENFINIPALITKEAVNKMAPEGATEDPIKYKGSKGILVIVGPDAPTGKKVSGVIRARSEVFRGALRPYTATVNQELREVLGSNIRLYLILGGNIEGVTPDIDNLMNSLLNLISDSLRRRNETIYYVDETFEKST